MTDLDPQDPAERKLTEPMRRALVDADAFGVVRTPNLSTLRGLGDRGLVRGVAPAWDGWRAELTAAGSEAALREARP